MYAVIADRGKQYLVREGERVRVDLLDQPTGSKVVFDRVLLIGGESGVQTGKPLVGGMRVEGVVLGEEKGPKLIVFHKRRRKYMRRKNGHRQHFTDVRVERIG
jgi:large subunit ribosomal protein L21